MPEPAPRTASPGTRRSTRSPTSRRCHSPPRMLNVKPSRFGGLERLLRGLRLPAPSTGIGAYGGGQFELGPGPRADPVPRLAVPPGRAERRRAGRLQRARAAAPGLPPSPLPPAPAPTGFRWGTETGRDTIRAPPDAHPDWTRAPAAAHPCGMGASAATAGGAVSAAAARHLAAAGLDDPRRALARRQAASSTWWPRAGRRRGVLRGQDPRRTRRRSPSRSRPPSGRASPARRRRSWPPAPSCGARRCGFDLITVRPRPAARPRAPPARRGRRPMTGAARGRVRPLG